MASTLKSVCLIEKDWENSVQIVWTFPDLDKLQTTLTLSRVKHFFCGTERGIGFVFCRCGRLFQYIAWRDENITRDVSAFGICVFAKDFNPKFYKNFLKNLLQTYAETHTPVPVLEQYLNIFTLGRSGELSLSDFDPKRALVQPFNGDVDLVDVVEDLGADFIVLWSALMFKKRVVVLHENVHILQELVSLLIHIVWHRRQEVLQNLHPVAALGKVEALHLTKSPYYIVGFTDKAHVKAYDVILDMNAKRVEISKECANEFQLCKFQKEIGQSVINAIQTERPGAQEFIKVLVGQATGLIQKLKSLGNDGVLTRDDIQSRGFQDKTLNFILNIAQAENLI